MIKVTSLHKYFFRRKRNEIHVLNDVSLTFPDQGLVVLLGASGSGKTTLLNVIGGLDKIDSGVINFDQHTIQGYKSSLWDKIRNEYVGYIFQNYNLLPHLSVYDNIALVLKMMGITSKELIDERVSYILHAVNMYPFRKKKATQLSGGQQQRVAIARALVKNPSVIIADEPTGNLDSKNTLEIMNIIKAISKERLVVLVTHEKDIARIYGDRIIEIKDGQLVDDYDNDVAHEHDVSDDNVVYLKDMLSKDKVDGSWGSFEFYQDVEQQFDPVKVRFIIKNKTLYLDVDSSIDKIKLVDKNSNLSIKDEHYIKKNKEEMLETSFRLDKLDNKQAKREYKSIVSLKQIFRLALQKILYSSVKGKMMLFSFIIAGGVIALAIALASSMLVPDISRRNFERDYVYIEDMIPKNITYNMLTTALQDEEDAYINTHKNARINVVDPLDETKSLVSVAGSFDISNNMKGKLIFGRTIQNDKEIVITSALAERMIQSNGAEFGIWSIEHLFFEEITVEGRDVKLVGIVESDVRIIYGRRVLANYLFPAVYVSTQSFHMFGSLKLSDYTLNLGSAPVENQVVVTNIYLILLGIPDPTAVTYPLTVPNHPYVISGVINDPGLFLIAPDSEVERSRFNNVSQYYVYTKHADELIKEFDTEGLRIYNEVDQLIEQFRAETAVTRVTIMIISSIIIGFTLIGFYFVMHSSMVSRIYEIAVYRALGMKKQELFTSFLIEIMILTTVTSIVGFVTSSYLLIRANETIIGDFRVFVVNPLTIILGVIIVYVINIFGGMFPVVLLLRKTPAQILAQYDI